MYNLKVILKIKSTETFEIHFTHVYIFADSQCHECANNLSRLANNPVKMLHNSHSYTHTQTHTTIKRLWQDAKTYFQSSAVVKWLTIFLTSN